MHVDLAVKLRRQYFLKVGIHCHEDVDKLSYIKSSINLVFHDKSSNSHSSCTAFTGKILIVIIPKNCILYLSDMTDPSELAYREKPKYSLWAEIKVTLFHKEV